MSKNSVISDFVFHYVESNEKCLIINPNMETFPENIPEFFNETFCLSIKNDSFRNEFNFSNVKFSKFENFKDNFSENSFDLILIYNWNEFQSKKSILLNILNETQKILKKHGCILFFIDNKNQNIDSLKNIEKIFNDLDFQISKNWVLPSIHNPLYSGNLNNLKSLTWFLKNIENFLPSFKQKSLKKNLFFKSFKIINAKLLLIFTKFFTPSFIVCCSQNKINSYESYLLDKTGLESSILVNRPFKFMYILFDKSGNPKKTVSLEKKMLDITDTENISQKLDEIAVYKDWVEGRIIDPLNYDEVLNAVSWIINFQNDNQQNLYENNEIVKEINSMRETFSNVSKLKKYPIFEWIDEYEHFLKNNSIHKTSKHGDLSHKNMILSPNMKKIDVIDWTFFEKIGNPMDDIGNFLFRLLIKSKSKSKIDAFKSKINNSDQEFNKLRIEIEKSFSNHFDLNFDLLFAIKYYFLKSLYTKIVNNNDLNLDLDYVSILSEVSK